MSGFRWLACINGGGGDLCALWPERFFLCDLFIWMWRRSENQKRLKSNVIRTNCIEFFQTITSLLQNIHCKNLNDRIKRMLRPLETKWYKYQVEKDVGRRIRSYVLFQRLVWTICIANILRNSFKKITINNC